MDRIELCKAYVNTILKMQRKKIDGIVLSKSSTLERQRIRIQNALCDDIGIDRKEADFYFYIEMKLDNMVDLKTRLYSTELEINLEAKKLLDRLESLKNKEK